MTQDAPHELGARIGYRLKEAQSVLRSRMDEALRPLDLTTPQYACLELLSRNPGASSSELARGAFVTRQTMSTLLRGLEDRGLIERSSHPSHGRALPTTLTPEGEHLLARACGVVSIIERSSVSGLDLSESRQLHEILGRYIDSLRGPGLGDTRPPHEQPAAPVREG